MARKGTARLASREATCSLPAPLTIEQQKAGHKPPYERRELHTHLLPMSEALQWMLDAAAAGVEPILQFALQRDKQATVTDGLMGLISVDRARGLGLVERLLRHTSVTFDGERVELNTRENLDEVFTGELLFLLQALQWVARENLESFTRGLPVPEAKPAKTQTPSESTSPTG